MIENTGYCIGQTSCLQTTPSRGQVGYTQFAGPLPGNPGARSLTMKQVGL